MDWSNHCITNVKARPEECTAELTTLQLVLRENSFDLNTGHACCPDMDLGEVGKYRFLAKVLSQRIRSIPVAVVD